MNSTLETQHSSSVSTGESRAFRWNVGALVAVLLTSVVLMFAPFMTSGESIEIVQDELGARTQIVESYNRSLLESEGFSVLVVLAVPVVVVAVPLLVAVEKRRLARQIATALLGVFVVLGMMSIGVFYLPTFLAMVAAVLAGRSSVPAA